VEWTAYTFVDPWWGKTRSTVQFDLTAARYDSSTKTCTNVGCHMAQGSTNFNPGGAVPVATPLIPLVWGDPYVQSGPSNTCSKCHPR
jgi:hypothetical protein